MKLRKKVHALVLCIGIIGCAFFLFGGFVLDDLRVAPFFGFRTESAQPVIRTTRVEANYYGCDQIVYEIEEGGAGGIGVTVTLIKGAAKMLRVGGDESAFVGFRDVDGDGIKEVLVNSKGRWAEKGVWKATPTGFAKTTPNLKSRIILGAARCLMWSLYGVFACFTMVCWSVVVILSSRHARAE